MQVDEVGGGTQTQAATDTQPEAKPDTSSTPETDPVSDAATGNGDTQRAEVAQYGAYRRAQVTTQLPPDDGGDEEGGANPGSLISGANSGRTAAVSQMQDTAEFFGYPPRTQQSNSAVLALEQAMNDAGVGVNSGQTLGALVRQDGSVALAVSGAEGGAAKVHQRTDPFLQDRLNQAFQNDPTIQRNANGDVVYQFGGPGVDADGFVSDITYRNLEGEPKLYQGNSSTCVEPKLFQAGDAVDAQGMTAKRYEINGTSRPNDYPARNNPGGLDMDPCPSCRVNTDEIQNGALPAAERNQLSFRNGLRQYGTSAAIGGGIAFATSTYDALQDGQLTGDEVQTIAGQTVLGAGSAVAGDVIQTAITRPALVNVNVTSSPLRLAATQVKGAAVAGAVVNTAFAVADQWDNLQNDATRSQAIGTIVGEAAVGAASGAAGAWAGAAAGAAIGSIVPGVGTVVGGVVGFAVGAAVGYLTDQGLRGLGVDQAIATGVQSAIDFGSNVASTVSNAVSDAANTVGGLFSGAAGALGSLFH